MRLVVVALIVMNVGYALWQWQRGQVSEPPQQIAEQVVPTIRLLTEVRTDQRQRQLDKVVSNPVLVDSDENNGECDALGPFLHILDGQTVLERLQALDAPFRLRALDEPTGEYDFRVMIPPVSSLEEAFRKLRELQSLGIDSYVITKGTDALAISLGVYSSDAAASVAQASHVKEGYESRIIKMPRLNRTFWLIHQESPAVSLPKAVFQEIFGEFPQISQANLGCSQRALIGGAS